MRAGGLRCAGVAVGTVTGAVCHLISRPSLVLHTDPQSTSSELPQSDSAVLLAPPSISSVRPRDWGREPDGSLRAQRTTPRSGAARQPPAPRSPGGSPAAPPAGCPLGVGPPWQLESPLAGRAPLAPRRPPDASRDSHPGRSRWEAAGRRKGAWRARAPLVRRLRRRDVLALLARREC